MKNTIVKKAKIILHNIALSFGSFKLTTRKRATPTLAEYAAKLLKPCVLVPFNKSVLNFGHKYPSAQSHFGMLAPGLGDRLFRYITISLTQFILHTLHQVEPYSWLRDVLQTIADHPINKITELLPHHSKK